MEPYLSGVAKNGGYLTEQEQILEINFACKNRDKDAMVELTIPLDYFKDISLFFIKRCSGNI